jgi:hypothetical protein
MIEYLSLTEAAEAIEIPIGTVKTWHADGVFPEADARIGSGTGSARRLGWLPKTVKTWARDNLPLDRRIKD